MEAGHGMRVRTIEIDGLHVVVCVKFDHRAPVSEIDAFKQSLIQSEEVTHSLEASGTFDFMVELALPDFQAYTSRMKALAGPMARLVERFETSFISRRFVPLRENDDGFWVPCRDALQRVRCRDIDWIRAEGDYVRVRSGCHDWLVNMTMGGMLARLDDRLFFQVHRSAIVRRDFIERLLHRNGRWEAQLSDGTTQRVAKSHVGHTLRSLRDCSSTTEPGFPATRRLVDSTVHPTESESAIPHNSGNVVTFP